MGEKAFRCVIEDDNKTEKQRQAGKQAHVKLPNQLQMI